MKKIKTIKIFLRSEANDTILLHFYVFSNAIPSKFFLTYSNYLYDFSFFEEAKVKQYLEFLLASLRINHLFEYCEHPFIYKTASDAEDFERFDEFL